MKEKEKAILEVATKIQKECTLCEETNIKAQHSMKEKEIEELNSSVFVQKEKYKKLKMKYKS